MEKNAIGMVGLGTMGSNLMLNIAGHGYRAIGYDKDASKVEAMEKKGNTLPVSATVDIGDFVSSLVKPARIILLVPAGKIVDTVIDELVPLLSKGDILIDGGNSFFKDTMSRHVTLATKGIHFFGMGISGGEEGALTGPSIMPSGDIALFHELQPILESIAASYDGRPCAQFMGLGAAGHFVKMVHNGIEYGMMQLIAETYDLMRRGMRLDQDQAGACFEKWNEGMLEGYLVEATAAVITTTDPMESGYLIDKIRDVARQKGTGKWTSQEAMDLQVPVPTIDMAVVARDLSAQVEVRGATGVIAEVPTGSGNEHLLRLEDLEGALFGAFLLTYIQGLHLIAKASIFYQFNTSMEAVIDNWRAGCIIRSGMLENFSVSFKKNTDIGNLLTDTEIRQLVQQYIPALKKVTGYAIARDLGCLAMGSALQYYTILADVQSPMNLIQGLRDYFGAHTFERTDRDGVFHHQWNDQQPKTE